MKKIPLTNHYLTSFREAKNIIANYEEAVEAINVQAEGMQALMRVNNILADALNAIPCECDVVGAPCDRCKVHQGVNAQLAEHFVVDDA